MAKNFHLTFMDEILELDRKDNVINPFIGAKKFPIGTEQPLSSYENVTDADFVYWELNPKEVTNILVVSWPGSLKTTIFGKRFLYYYFHYGYDCLVYDPKHHDMIYAKNKSSGKGLHPKEKADKLPLYPAIPSYVTKQMPLDLMKKFNIFSSKISDYKTRLEWNTVLGIKAAESGASEVLLKYAKKCSTMEEAFEMMKKDRNIHPTTRKALFLRVENMIEDGVFDRKHPGLNLEAIWGEKKIPTIHFFSRDKRYIGFTVGKMTEEIQRYSEKVNNPKFIIYDDAAYYANASLDQSNNIAIANLINSIIHWRSFNFNGVFCVQNPRVLNPEILEDCKHKFIGPIGDPDLLRGIVHNDIIEVVRNLRYEPDNHIIEYCWVKPDRRSYKTFFPLAPICGHPGR